MLAEIVGRGTPDGAVQRPSLRRWATSRRFRRNRLQYRSSDTACPLAPETAR